MTYPPPPIPPIGVPPIPIAPLPYSPPMPVRPGILTAVGVISLILGGLGILASVGGVGRALIYGVASKMSVTAATATPGMVTVGPNGTMTVTPPSGPALPLSISPNAVTTADALAALEPLTPKQKDQILGLLGTQGDWVLATPDGGGNWTAADALRMVRTHGPVAATPDIGGNGFFFQTSDGRLEVHDTFAIFRPTGGTLISSSVQRDAAGQLVSTDQSPADDGSIATTPNVAVPGPGRQARARVVPPFRFTASPGAIRLSVLAEGLCLILGLLLVVAGAQVLRNAPSGRKLHMIWAVIKLPIIALTAVASAWLTSSTLSSFAGVPTASAGLVKGIGLGSVAVFAFLQLVYPVAVLIVMNTPVAKQWFAADPGTVR